MALRSSLSSRSQSFSSLRSQVVNRGLKQQSRPAGDILAQAPAIRGIGNGAFAISGMADWGSTAGRTSEADAVGSAIAACEASADHAIASYSNETRRRINQQGQTDCTVIHITRP